MPEPFELSLNQEQEHDLLKIRDHDRKPYLRPKAGAILKVAAGASIRQVALHGLHKPFSQETVRDWIGRYLRDGRKGLLVQKGRGRKPAFSPCASAAGASHRAGARHGASRPPLGGHPAQ